MRVFPFLVLWVAVELLLLIASGRFLGVWPTFAAILLTGAVGLQLAKHQGVAIFRRIREELQSGRIPGDALLEGFLVFVGGVFLILPGFLSDLAGIALLIPPLRRKAARLIRDCFLRRLLNRPFFFMYRR